MENPLNNGCKPNEHYGVSKAALLLGVTRPTIYRYIKLGYIKLSWHKALMANRIKGTEIIGFYNKLS